MKMEDMYLVCSGEDHRSDVHGLYTSLAEIPEEYIDHAHYIVLVCEPDGKIKEFEGYYIVFTVKKRGTLPGYSVSLVSVSNLRTRNLRDDGKIWYDMHTKRGLTISQTIFVGDKEDYEAILKKAKQVAKEKAKEHYDKQ